VLNASWATAYKTSASWQRTNTPVAVENILFYFDESGQKIITDIGRLPFTDTLRAGRKINTGKTGKGAYWLRIRLPEKRNTEGELVFFAGQHRKTALYSMDKAGRIIKISGSAPRWNDHILAKDLIVFKTDTTFLNEHLVQIYPYKYNHQPIKPKLLTASEIQPDLLLPSGIPIILRYKWFNLLSYGAIAMILAFFIFQYAVLRAVEYPAYIAFITCMLLNGVNEWIMTTGQGSVYQDLKHIFHVTLSILSYCFYMQFSTKLLNLRERLPATYRFIRILMMVLTAYAGVDLIAYYLLGFPDVAEVVFLVIRIGILLISLALVLKAYSLRDKVSGFFVSGSSSFMAGGLIYIVIYHIQRTGTVADSIWTYPPFYYRMGAIFEVLFFSMGLAYKTNLSERERTVLEIRLEQEKMQREADLEVARQETIEIERNRLSRDLHDEVGMGLTRIRYLLELLKRNQQDVRDLEIEPIAQESNRVIQTMHDIVWSLKTGEHSVEEFLANMRGTVVEYLETYGILLKFEVTGDLKSVELSPLQKRNILLIVRECLHNVIRHSRATEVKVEMRIHRGLSLYISDNGIGAGPRMNQGNGVANMRRRMEECGGSFEWKNNFENGVSVIAEIRNSKA